MSERASWGFLQNGVMERVRESSCSELQLIRKSLTAIREREEGGGLVLTTKSESMETLVLDEREEIGHVYCRYT